MKYKDLREEEFKIRIAEDYFHEFDTGNKLKDIDFAVKKKASKKQNTSKKGHVQDSIDTNEYYLWAEAKTDVCEIIGMLTQLILTIGKARTFENIQPPPYLGCFDYKKMAFVPYYEIQDVFYLNDFNWNVTPSNSGTKEFQLVYEKLDTLINKKLMIFDFEKDGIELRSFIKDNFVMGKIETSKIQITKNNFTWVYAKWVIEVKPTIGITDWNLAKKQGIFDLDFYLADILSIDNVSFKDKLNVVLKHTQYEFNRHIDGIGSFNAQFVSFQDGQIAHSLFWTKYERPPREEYWDYIMDRRDLLVPQDIRERKGSFFTPKIWVELSQKYLAEVFGEDWQEEYFIWDCAAGTGNLLAGLTNKYNIWASTIDKADVDVMLQRIKSGANLLESHVFQFDFLNDDFSRLPDGLKEIVKGTPEKLIIYINPPYAEAGDIKQRVGTGKNKTNVSKNIMHDKYHLQLSGANRQLYAQFLIRIYNEISMCKIGEFSTLKTLSGAHFDVFREYFKAKLLKAFIVPANTFDNVVGNFPIGFKIWDTRIKENIKKSIVDVFDKTGIFKDIKNFYTYEGYDYISKWVNSFKHNSGIMMAWLQGVTRNDFQNQNGITIRNKKEQISVPRGITIYDSNIIESCVCYAIRMCIPANWLNDCDQFLYPSDSWKNDKIFHSDCLTYTLFHSGNCISTRHGVNHWIPFSEEEVQAKDKFKSSFMTDYISGKFKKELRDTITFDGDDHLPGPMKFSPRATDAFDAGRELWKYYHAQPNCNVNASFYDIREHFQGRDDKGRMNATSKDDRYNMLLAELKLAMKFLAHEIEPKIYEYGFLQA